MKGLMKEMMEEMMEEMTGDLMQFKQVVENTWTLNACSSQS